MDETFRKLSGGKAIPPHPSPSLQGGVGVGKKTPDLPFTSTIHSLTAGPLAGFQDQR